VQHRFEVVPRKLVVVAEVGDARVEHRRVELAPRRRVLERAIDVGNLRQIGGDRIDFDLRFGLELSLQIVEPVLAARERNQIRPMLAREHAGHRFAEARGSPGQQDPLPPKIHCFHQPRIKHRSPSRATPDQGHDPPK
jgi:hypothetical protein